VWAVQAGDPDCLTRMVEALIRELARLMPDKTIASLLNRAGKPTGLRHKRPNRLRTRLATGTGALAAVATIATRRLLLAMPAKRAWRHSIQP
jgi:hypothetical protein